MGARDPAEAVEVMHLLLKFFGDGERWVKGRLSDRRGNRCLVGGARFRQQPSWDERRLRRAVSGGRNFRRGRLQ
jgi:hypothetical protein